MTRKIHFIAGLPRSGSTLLSAILRQNPRFHAGVSSPLAPIFLGLQTAVSRKNEAAALFDQAQKRELFKAIFSAYYHAVPDGHIVFDTSRIWPSKLPILASLFPETRMICCVRDISWIIDSVERLTRRNLFDLSAIFDYEPGHTVYTRAERLVAPDGLVGSALGSLREGYYGEQSDRMLIIDYEALVRNAEEAVAKVYMFLGEEPFRHTFENLEYDVPEYDASIGTPNLHTVRPKVEWVERKTILPPDLFERFAEQSFWKYPEQNRNDVPVILHGS